MKKLLLMIVSLTTGLLNLNAQDYFSYYINFDDPDELFRIYIDTVQNPDNIWQIGPPQKTQFNAAFSPPNVVVTDTINPYPANDTSVFYVIHLAQDGFIYPHTVILSGQYKASTTGPDDYGMIEFSPDQGETWVNLIDDPVYNQYLWWQTPKPQLYGQSDGWEQFYVNIADLGYIFNIDFMDTLLYRFTFISDGAGLGQAGLMFDDLHFEDWYETIDEYVGNGMHSRAFPNPSSGLVNIRFENPENHTFELTLYDLNGKLLRHYDQPINNIFTLDANPMNSGIYFYQLTDLQTQKITSGRFLIEN